MLLQTGLLTQTSPHARTHTGTQVNIEKDNNCFLSAFLNKIFDDLLRIERGRLFLSLTYSNKRHQQELLHEKLNYLNTQKRQQITLNSPASKDAAIIIADR